MDDIDLNELPENHIPVLDHGYVSLVKVNGTDDDIVEAARLSYGRGTKKVSSGEGLIRYLYMNAHTSPFEMVGMKFQMRLPIFGMRQLVRHRTANLNEYSGRYSVMPRLFYIPEVTRMTTQSKTNKQGSSNEMITSAEHWRTKIINHCDDGFDLYEALIAEDTDLSRELARIHLPMNTYTEVMWNMDLSNLLKFLWLRDDPHSQWEIREYARIISNAVAVHFPYTFKAYTRKRSMTSFTADQMKVIGSMMLGKPVDRKMLDALPKSELQQINDLVNAAMSANLD